MSNSNFYDSKWFKIIQTIAIVMIASIMSGFNIAVTIGTAIAVIMTLFLIKHLNLDKCPSCGRKMKISSDATFSGKKRSFCSHCGYYPSSGDLLRK